MIDYAKRKPWIRTPLLVLLLFVLYYLFMFGSNLLPIGNGHVYNQRKNGIWLGRKWVRGRENEFSPAQMTSALRAFHKRGIMYLYPHCCPMDEAGNLPAVNVENIQALQKIIAENNWDFQIYPWVGGSIATVSLESESQAKEWSRQVAKLVETYDFPGVNVNIEPLEHGDERVFMWLRQLRKDLGPSRKISFCSVRPENDDTLGDGYVWTEDDYKKLLPLIDQLTVMSYDTGRKVAFAYEHWTRKQYLSLRNLVEIDGNCEFLWGVPTYEDQADYFSPKAENIRTSLRGLIRGLRKNHYGFTGISLYADWTIDEKEWAVYDAHWAIEEKALLK